LRNGIGQWISFHLKRMVNSIAFYPALIGLAFLAVSYFMISLDYSESGKALKAQWDWLRMRDAETARSVISVVAAGILSLTVFSFSMVMIVLNQAASQLSNRILDQLIGNRFQQLVLGFYIGTIVYGLFLLTAIRDIDEGIYVPALSTYLLILFAVLDIFLFIYFLHYITQSVKYVVIIQRIARRTQALMRKHCKQQVESQPFADTKGQVVKAQQSGLLNGFDNKALLAVVAKEDVVVSVLHPVGHFVLEGTPLLQVSGERPLTDAFTKALNKAVYLVQESSLDDHYYYGLRRLTEIALRALSPGVNDPGTAVESLRSLATLLHYRLQHHPNNAVKDEEGQVRIVCKAYSFDELVELTLYPIWDYGKNDRFMQEEFRQLLPQFEALESRPSIRKLMAQLQQQAAEQNL
jgi:uncharacterized membrane protein